MSLITLRSGLFFFLAVLAGEGFPQIKPSAFQIGYFAPYLTNTGAIAGAVFDWNKKAASPLITRLDHHIQLLTEVGYFTHLGVSHNFLLNPAIRYRSAPERKWAYMASIGMGYLLSLQRQEGTLHLATGHTEYRIAALNDVLPNAQVAIAYNPQRRVGFYLKATYGRQWSVHRTSAAFVAMSSGLTIHISPKSE